MIDEDLDSYLERKSAQSGMSKAAIIRGELKQSMKPLVPIDSDPVRLMAGRDSFEPAKVDDVVYR